MNTPKTMLLSLVLATSATHADEGWFLPRSCTGPELTISVDFDGARIFDAAGPACDEYENDLDQQWEKEMLSFEFEPERAITWVGYREHPFDSPADAALEVTLWLAGAERAMGVWFIGVSVAGEDTIYMNTLHFAEFSDTKIACIAENLCIQTSTD